MVRSCWVTVRPSFLSYFFLIRCPDLSDVKPVTCSFKSCFLTLSPGQRFSHILKRTTSTMKDRICSSDTERWVFTARMKTTSNLGLFYARPKSYAAEWQYPGKQVNEGSGLRGNSLVKIPAPLILSLLKKYNCKQASDSFLVVSSAP